MAEPSGSPLENDVDLMDLLFSAESLAMGEQPVTEPQINSAYLEIVSQPVEFCRARTMAEINGFQQGAAASSSCGSRLRGRDGSKSHVLVRLTSTVRVSGRLLGLPVGSGNPPLRLHLIDLFGGDCREGLFEKRIELQANEPANIMLTNVGLVKCKAADLTAKVDAKTQVLNSLLLDPSTNCLFQISSSGHRLLSMDALKDAKDNTLRILFAFIPSEPALRGVPCVITEAVECAAGAAGGKGGLTIEGQSPRVVPLREDFETGLLTADEDVWIHLGADIKVLSEKVEAYLQLPLDDGGHLARVPTDVNRNFVKVLLSRLQSGAFGHASSQNEKFSAKLTLKRLSNHADRVRGAAAETSVIIELLFSRPCQEQPSVRRRKTAERTVDDVV